MSAVVNTSSTSPVPVLVIGAGLMGAGIAQVAAQAGHAVRLYDTRAGAAAAACEKLAATLDQLAAKGKISAEAARASAARLGVAETLADAADAGLVVEAIVERLDAKRALLRELEAVVGADCVLASNTSSISVTALANGLRHPGRVVGMHFFNPVPLMKLVEVVSGLQTAPAVAQQIEALARHWGKTPVHTRSTPGFIVNRIARPYYAETLALLQEQAATPALLDACLRAAGFRMGPCELMDLIGHDTNFAVTESVYAANFSDKRYQPSLVQRELVDAGLFGRKSGRGFYDYSAAVPIATADAVVTAERPAAERIVVHGRGHVAEQWAARLQAEDCVFERAAASDWTGLQVDQARLALTDGRPATQCVAEGAPADLVLMDWPIASAVASAPWVAGTRVAVSVAAQAGEAWIAQAAQWLRWAGLAPQPMADAPGLVVARTVAMLINEASDAVHQGVCDAQGADAAMKLGVNYPAGPFEWLAACDARAVVQVLDALDAHYRGERYRVSPGLRLRVWRDVTPV